MKFFTVISALIFAFASGSLFASESKLILPDLSSNSHYYLLFIGLGVCVLGALFGLYQFIRIKAIKAHRSMTEISELIFITAKTYLISQGKFLAALEAFIAVIIIFYFGVLEKMPVKGVLLILGWSVVGILGSFAVAWFGIRINTLANSRMAFDSLRRIPVRLLLIPLEAGMSIGVLLVSVELLMMLSILLFIPGEYAGACFIGFAIGESLGASALRICGGIFTKIADIGSDMMKIVFKIKEDDPRNPGTIADCTGDNAGDSVGPSADGFETYGVTGVALISFIILGVFPEYQSTLIIWIFAMRIIMILTSLIAYKVNNIISVESKWGKDDFDFEKPLTRLIWITSLLSILVTFGVSYLLIGTNSALPSNLWIILSSIISCGTLGAAIIPELTKIFTSPSSRHTREVVTSSEDGGASLNILSGISTGSFSAFWVGSAILLLMGGAYILSGHIPHGAGGIMNYPAVFSFGLVAFGLLGMGPVTIAVDSYGPVADNAQSIYELSMIEEHKNISEEIENDYGFKPDFENAKLALEANDGAGNTFKATAKPVLISTAVIGASTMIFSLILVLKATLGIEPDAILSLLNPYALFGFMAGGAVIFWFSGASIQAVTTGAYRAVGYIKENIKLDGASKSASVENSREVVQICTNFAQQGMYNIFGVIASFTLGFAFISAANASNPAPSAFFISYLISLAVFGLFQAIYMANAGGCWDNAKKVVEVDLRKKNTQLHEATVIGDTVGDPFKDTTSVAINPIIKFTTLFGILAMEIAISDKFVAWAPYAGYALILLGLFFVARSFYGMRIPKKNIK